MAKISVIIPVYNAEKTLTECVASVLDQTFSDIEVILIDDGSGDGSLSVCTSLEAADDRITVYSFENHGAAYCRNFGVKCSSGEYIAFVDSDDAVDPDALSYMYKVAQERSADIVMCGYIIENGKSKKTVSADDGFYTGEELNSRMIEIKSKNLIDSPCNKLYRRVFLDESGVVMPENEIYEDTDFNLRLISFKPRFAVCSAAFYHYILHQGSTTRRFNPEKLETIKRRALLLSDVTEGIGNYCDFYYIKSVFSAFIDAFLSLPGKQVYSMIKNEISTSDFKDKAANANHSGMMSKAIVFVARARVPAFVYLFCRLSYLLKYKSKRLI